MTRFGFIRSAITRERPWWFGSAAVFACVGAATLIRVLFGQAAAGVPFVTYFPAILVCGLLVGFRYGVASIVLSIGIVWMVFLPPDQRLVADPRSLAMVAFFLLSCLVIVAVADSLRRTLIELEASRAQAQSLASELNHRSRNLLAVIQAIARQSVRSSPDNFLVPFEERVNALAAAYDSLARSGLPDCDLREIVERSCAPFCSEDAIVITGPPFSVPALHCIPLTLALHELCTNATKYGALSVPGGKVDISWEVIDAMRARVSWTEAGGPPVAPPSRRGMGTVLLKSQSELKQVSMQFAPDGLRCQFEVGR
jgi:two-component sensor histidine kinase